MKTLYIVFAASLAFASPALACCGGDKQPATEAEGKSMCMKGMDHSNMGESKSSTQKSDPHAGMDGGNAPKSDAPMGKMKKAGCGCCGSMNG